MRNIVVASIVVKCLRMSKSLDCYQTCFDGIHNLLYIKKVLRYFSCVLPPKINSLYQGKVVFIYLCRYACLCPAHSCHCRHKSSCPLYWCSPCCTHHSACPCTHWCRHTSSGPCSWIMIYHDFSIEWAQYYDVPNKEFMTQMWCPDLADSFRDSTAYRIWWLNFLEY